MRHGQRPSEQYRRWRREKERDVLAQGGGGRRAREIKERERQRVGREGGRERGRVKEGWMEGERGSRARRGKDVIVVSR